jgi:hypothetical protein
LAGIIQKKGGTGNCEKLILGLPPCHDVPLCALPRVAL